MTFDGWLRRGPQKSWAAYNAMHPAQPKPQLGGTATYLQPTPTPVVVAAPKVVGVRMKPVVVTPNKIPHGLVVKPPKIPKVPKVANPKVPKVAKVHKPKITKIAKVQKPKVAKIQKPKVAKIPKVAKVQKPRVRKKKSIEIEE